MLCNHCGFWNAEDETRCSRCGRRPERSSREDGRRLPAVSSSFVLPPLSRGNRSEMPPLPSRKRQLDSQLDAYRNRPKARQAVPVPATSGAETVSPAARHNSQVITFQPLSGPDDASETDTGSRASTASVLQSGQETDLPGPKLPPLARTKPGQEDLTGEEPREEVPLETSLPEVSAQSERVPGTAPMRARFIAGVMDVAVAVVALGVFLGVFHNLGDSLGTDVESFRTLGFVFVGILFFYWIFYLRYVGETAGMTWMRLRIVSVDGQAPSDLQKWGRAVGTILSCCAAGLGFLWALADEEKLTWHDRMSQTYVTDEPFPPSLPPVTSLVGSVQSRTQSRAASQTSLRQDNTRERHEDSLKSSTNGNTH